MGKRINLALFGVGYWGNKLLAEYLELQKEYPDFKLVKVVDIDKDKLALTASKFNLPSAMLSTDYEKCLHDQEVDAIHIATPNETHFLLAYNALLNNKHVLVEKPMTMNTRDAFKLTRLAEKNDNVLLVGHIFRFNNSIEKAKRFIDGILGDLYYFNLHWLDYIDPLPDRDIIFDLLPHPIDILNYLTDDWPVSIFARAESYKNNKRHKEDVAFITLELSNRILAHVTLSWLHRLKQRTITITSSKYTLHIDALNQELTLYKKDSIERVNIDKNNTMKDMIMHFLSCINGIDKPNNSGLIGAIVVNVLVTAKRSLNEVNGLRLLE
ncbi:MAG: Gfo/Idh/MocA family oxidoreductase [Candidatus Nitrosocaldaceae archaeon]